MILKPSTNVSFDCYVDASHAGDWNRNTAASNPDTARSRTGFVISYANCPITWQSRMQTEIALSSTEAEYIALSQAMREVLPLIALMKEAKKKGLFHRIMIPRFHCKIFEDNSGALEMARTPKMRPRTKHLNVKYHFFREHVKSGIVSIHQIPTETQIADIFTKPLSQESFERHRQQLLHW